MRKMNVLLLLTFLLFMACPPAIMAQRQAKAIVLNTNRQTLPKAFKLLEKATTYKVMYETNEVKGYTVARDVRAKDINDEMKVAAAYAIAGLIKEDELTADYIIPNPFDKRVVKAVAEAVAEKARETGVARL